MTDQAKPEDRCGYCGGTGGSNMNPCEPCDGTGRVQKALGVPPAPAEPKAEPCVWCSGGIQACAPCGSTGLRSASTPPQPDTFADVREAVTRVEKFLAERAKVRGLDPEEVHGFNVGTDREAHLFTADLRAMLAEIDRMHAVMRAERKLRKEQRDEIDRQAAELATLRARQLDPVKVAEEMVTVTQWAMFGGWTLSVAGHDVRGFIVEEVAERQATLTRTAIATFLEERAKEEGRSNE